MKLNRKRESADIATRYKDIEFTLDELMALEENISRECWRYLVGKFCKNESKKRRESQRVRDVYENLGRIFGYKSTSLKRVVAYSEAIDHLHSLLPDVAISILNGEMRISKDDTIALSRLKLYEINDVMARCSNENTLAKLIRSKKARASIKDTPIYDPNAQINTLAYTVPSWTEMIERAFDTSDFNNLSPVAKSRLSAELEKLLASIEALRDLLVEVVE